ncbi:MAG: hypothetical protein MH204_00540 [Fimbriimonadaceae bacterium]|nr:hypothetical protein [Fimbriimonadaceae bacterium]
MASVKEGDLVRVVERPLTTQDRSVHSLFPHMLGLTGVVQSVYGPDEVAVKINLEDLKKTETAIHKTATDRMRTKFLENVGEEQKKRLTKEELNFVPNYVILVREADLERI